MLVRAPGHEQVGDLGDCVLNHKLGSRAPVASLLGEFLDHLAQQSVAQHQPQVVLDLIARLVVF